MPKSEYVFSYGWLLTTKDFVPKRQFDKRGYVTDLKGFQRYWGVAMNNSLDLPGYKYYLDSSGKRPDIFVAFLDIKPNDNSLVNGVCIEVDEELLRDFDAVEIRHYKRVDVTKHIESPQGKTWAYVGTDEGHERLELAKKENKLCIDKNYLEGVKKRYLKIGKEEYNKKHTIIWDRSISCIRFKASTN